ncbi:MAG: hypothetical protein ACRD21_09970, partial [Vicinamibacteria bacterium]
ALMSAETWPGGRVFHQVLQRDALRALKFFEKEPLADDLSVPAHIRAENEVNANPELVTSTSPAIHAFDSQPRAALT